MVYVGGCGPLGVVPFLGTVEKEAGCSNLGEQASKQRYSKASALVPDFRFLAQAPDLTPRMTDYTP